MTEVVTTERLVLALAGMARIVAADSSYLCLYERLENELLDRRSRDDALSRAKAMARAVQQRVLQSV